MKQRQGRNRIDSIYTEQETLLKTPDDIEQEFIGFYKKLLGSKAPSLPGIDFTTVRRGTQLSVSAAEILIAPVTHSEIDQALKDIEDSKAPGIDGFNNFFFKKVWSVVKQDIYNAIQYFFEKGVMAKQWSCTTITLVPKVAQPSYAKEFRPIACCTVI